MVTKIYLDLSAPGQPATNLNFARVDKQSKHSPETEGSNIRPS